MAPASRGLAAAGLSACAAAALLAAATSSAIGAVESRWAWEAAPAGSGWTRAGMSTDDGLFLVQSVFPGGYEPMPDLDTIVVYDGGRSLLLVGPDGTPIEEGAYPQAGNVFAPTPGKPAIGYSDGFIGCGGNESGSFTVHELVREGTQVTKLAVDYELTCHGNGTTVAGQVRFHSDLPLEALVDETSYFDPLPLGTANVGESASGQFQYTNRGDGSVTFGEATIEGPDAEDFELDGCQSAVLAPGAACEVDVTFNAESPGWAEAWLVLPVDTTLGFRRIPLRTRGITPTSITLDGSTGAHSPPDVLTFSGKVTPTPTGQDRGLVRILFKSPDGTYAQHLLEGPPAEDGSYSLSLDLGQWMPLSGDRIVTAEYSGTFEGNHLGWSTSEGLQIKLLRPTSVSFQAAPNPVLASVPVTLNVWVLDGQSPIDTGTVTIVDAFDGATLLDDEPLPGLGNPVTLTRTLKAGTHVLTATFPGHGEWAPSQASLELVVEPDDVVLADGQEIQWSTFYPVKDGYRDRVAISGYLHEPADVTVRVLNEAGRRVALMELGERVESYWTYWYGRNAAGNVLPEGRYRVVQRLTDGAGNVSSFTHRVTLSRQRLVWSSHTITKDGDAVSATGEPGNAWVSTARSAYPDGIRLSSGSQWAAARWTFAIRAAQAYGRMTVSVLGRGTTAAPCEVGIWSWDLGDPDNAIAYTRRAAGRAYDWYSVSGPGYGHQRARRAHGEVLCENSGTGTRGFDVQRVRLQYRYGVLSG